MTDICVPQPISPKIRVYTCRVHEQSCRIRRPEQNRLAKTACSDPSGQNPDKIRTSQRNPLQQRHLRCPEKNVLCPDLSPLAGRFLLSGYRFLCLGSAAQPSEQNRKKPEIKS